MNKPKDPRQLAVDLLPRSVCHVQTAAVLADGWGIFSWGVNHVGFDGLGCHAEAECLRRANRHRLEGATMYVAGVRRRNGKIVGSRPCQACLKAIRRVGWVMYRDRDGMWRRMDI